MDDLLTRGVANISPSQNELEKVLKTGKKLNIYIGIDPTATKIHLGHAMPLRKLQEFAKLGHNITFLIGDFTALIGDTSDKDSERPSLTSEEIKENFQSYKEQAEKILDFSKIKVRFNSEWLSKLSFEEIIKLSQNFSVGDFVGRELIKKRLAEGKRVGLHEFMYPVMQGYDSYFMDTDIQIGGADQIFNMQAGRTLQKNLRNKDSFVLCTDYLLGTDGRKMSKSWGNAIWLSDEPKDMYRKVMAINDDQIKNYFVLATNLPLSEIPSDEEIKNNPLEIKKKLANIIVSDLHSTKDAEIARNFFEGRTEEEIRTVKFDSNLNSSVLDVIINAGLLNSSSEVKRKFSEKGIKINDEIPENLKTIPLEGDIISVGRNKIKLIKS
jgi:tyrosyl-tRNA synthetase